MVYYRFTHIIGVRTRRGWPGSGDGLSQIGQRGDPATSTTVPKHRPLTGQGRVRSGGSGPRSVACSSNKRVAMNADGGLGVPVFLHVYGHIHDQKKINFFSKQQKNE